MAIKYLWTRFIVCNNWYANLLHFPINFSARHYISIRRSMIKSANIQEWVSKVKAIVLSVHLHKFPPMIPLLEQFFYDNTTRDEFLGRKPIILR